VIAFLAACGHLRDRFLLALLAETGRLASSADKYPHDDFRS
jgi:hypothetical protein